MTLDEREEDFLEENGHIVALPATQDGVTCHNAIAADGHHEQHVDLAICWPVPLQHLLAHRQSTKCSMRAQVEASLIKVDHIVSVAVDVEIKVCQPRLPYVNELRALVIVVVYCHTLQGEMATIYYNP